MPVHVKWEETTRRHKPHLSNRIHIRGKGGSDGKIAMGHMELELPDKSLLIFKLSDLSAFVEYLKKFLAKRAKENEEDKTLN